MEGSLWTTLHFALSAEIVRQLAPRLRLRYLYTACYDLRRGRRVPMQEPLPAMPYFVFLSRAEKRPLTEIWPIALSAPLPLLGPGMEER